MAETARTQLHDLAFVIVADVMAATECNQRGRFASLFRHPTCMLFAHLTVEFLGKDMTNAG